MQAKAPMVTPHMTMEPAPIEAPRWTWVRSSQFAALSYCLAISGIRALRGYRSLVKVTDGPTKTSSSIVTPFHTIEPFLIVTRLPSRAPLSTNA